MQKTVVRAAAPLLALALATAAHAQQADSAAARRPSVFLLPSIGTAEGSVLGTHLGADPATTGLSDTRVFGLAVQARTPLRGVDLRAGLSYARPRLEQETAPGVVTSPSSPATVVSGTVEAVVHGPRMLGLRPYAFGGGGFRWFSWDAAELELVAGTPLVGDQVSPLLRYGAGVAWDVGRYDLYLEHARTHVSLKDGHLFQAAQAEDVSWTLGLRIPIK